MNSNSSLGSHPRLYPRIAVSGFFFLAGFCFSSWGARIPEIQEKLSLSESGLGTVLFAMPVGSLLSMPVAAWTVNRFGSRRTLVLSMFLYGLMLVWLGFAPSVLSLLCGLFCFGFIGNFINVSLNTQGIDVEALYQRPIMASLHGLWSSAGFAGAALGSVMIGNSVTPLIHFIVVASLVLLVILGSRRFLLPDRRVALEATRSSMRFPGRDIFFLGLVAFLSMTCEGAMFDWSGVYFKKVVLAQGPWVSAGYVSFMTTMASSRFLADRLKAKIGFGKILFFSGLLIGSGLLIAVLLPYLVSSILGFLLVGAGVSALVPMVMSEAGKTDTMAPSSAVAWVSTIGFLGFLIGPPLIGWIAGMSSLKVSFCVIAMLGFSITAVSFRKRI